MERALYSAEYCKLILVSKVINEQTRMAYCFDTTVVSFKEASQLLCQMGFAIPLSEI